jgi:3-hydroxyisobutyrate dehydrogenase
MLSLLNWGIVQEVIEGKEGVLQSATEGQIIIDTSTVPPWETKVMAKKLAKRGIDWMDVPVCGSSAKAQKGDMIFIAGGEKSTFNRVKAVLDKISKKTIYAGSHGYGAMLKLVHNQILFLNQIAAIEGFAVGLKAGLDPDIMMELMTSADASSDIIKARGRDMLRGDFSAKGPVWVAVKDVETILENAKRLGVVAPVAGLYHQLLLQAKYNNWEASDATVVLKIYENLAGIKRKNRA